jgi:acyl carrier protein|tara:strand:+ start:413 stop:631 length:219 start_codon:yes stop_codon:yes gene_type:complete
MEVENIIAQHLNIDVSEVTDDKHLMEDLGADSLHTVELVIEFENHFDMTIPDEDAEQLQTVKQIKEYIAEYA